MVSTREINVDYLLPVLQLIVKTSGFRRDTGIRNNHIQVPEVFHHGIYSYLDL